MKASIISVSLTSVVFVRPCNSCEFISNFLMILLILNDVEINESKVIFVKLKFHEGCV
jgi:hypothetical protein